MSKIIKVISSIAFENHHLKLLKKHHIDLQFLKMMDIKFKSNDQTIVDLNDIDVPFVFTSQYAVQFVLDLVNENKFNTCGKKCFAIQGTTSQLLNESNFEILGQANDSEGLATIILEQNKKQVIHITSDWRLPTLENKLKHKVDYKALEVYDKIPIKSIVGEYDALVFSSPSHVDTFITNNIIPIYVPCICIGSTTEKHLNIKGHQNTIKAESRSKEGLIETLMEYYNRKENKKV